MKKIFLILVIFTVLLPFSAFAIGPSEFEVEQATAAVMSSFGMVFLTSMFGEIPEGVTTDIDMSSGESTIKYDNFDAADFFKSFSEMEEMSDGEFPEIQFKTMSGSISVDENGGMICDMTLKGGPVKTLQMETSGDDLIYLKANGKDFTYLDDVLEAE